MYRAIIDILIALGLYLVLALAIAATYVIGVVLVHIKPRKKK